MNLGHCPRSSPELQVTALLEDTVPVVAGKALPVGSASGHSTTHGLGGGGGEWGGQLPCRNDHELELRVLQGTREGRGLVAEGSGSGELSSLWPVVAPQ